MACAGGSANRIASVGNGVEGASLLERQRIAAMSSVASTCSFLAPLFSVLGPFRRRIDSYPAVPRGL